MTEKEKLKNTLLDILTTLTAVLERHGIHTFLLAGSCLGAIRHGGFIPWDDDIDVGLLREDYEKAREILINELPEGYTYCDERLEKEYPYSFGKVRRDGTAFVHGGDAHLNIHQGIYIDIFPFDSIPDDEALFLKQYKKSQRLKRKIDLKCMSFKKGGRLRPLFQLPLILAGHLFVNKARTQRKLHRVITQYNALCDSSKYLMNFLGNWGKRERVEREWFGKIKTVDFQGVSAYIPENYDPYLTYLYGDYMTPPPEDKRMSHHDAIFISDCEEYSHKK